MVSKYLLEDEEKTKTEYIDCIPYWIDCLSRLYFYFHMGNMDGYSVEKTYYSYDLPKVDENQIIHTNNCEIITKDHYDNGSLMSYSFINITPPVIFTPEISPNNQEINRKTGYGTITDGKINKIFYDSENGSISVSENGSNSINRQNILATEI